MKDISIGDLLRDYIDKLLDDDYDFSYASKRREAMHTFCELHKDKGFKPEIIRTYFRKILTKCLREKGQDPRPTGAGKKGLRFVPDMQAYIQPEPQPEAYSPEKVPEEQEQKPLALKPIIENISNESIGAFFAGLFFFLKIWYTELEGLTEQEKESLAEMWKPAFQKYLSEKFALIVVPTIATIGMFAPKLYKARKLKKEKETHGPEKRKEDNDKK